ncbi:MAG: glycosyltransferase [Flavobacteriales bacterium]|nr:glycosyltransferase [Flavobacteriales bacterium]
MDTPVLLLVYNRPEHTLQVLQRLKDCGATTVFVSGDGPKNSQDKRKTDEVKACVNRFSSMISASRFSERNRGCKNSVIDGINWFFEQVEEGIILEDDCLPSEHFFPFINELLNRYREEKKVQMISGNNPLGSWDSEGNHFFSRIGHIWGWATWKDRWIQFNSELPELQKFILNNGFERAFGPTHLAETRKQLTLQSVQGKIDTWDYQWMAHILIQNGLAIVPSENLVENIGFDNSGTNLTKKPNWIHKEAFTGKTQTEPDYPFSPSSADSDSPFEKGVSRNETGDYFEIDREYQMTLELARRANAPANPSSFWFKSKWEKEKRGKEKGRDGKRMLKILIINSTDMGGGAEKLALMLHSKLLALGHDVRFLVKTKKTNLKSVFATTKDWKTQILDFNPDVIHVHNLHDSSIELTELAEISNQIPVLWTLHDTWLISGSKDHAFQPYPTQLNLIELRKWKREFESRKAAILKGNFRFTAPSQWMRERFFDAHQTVPFYVPNAVELVAPTQIESPSERFILFVANRPKTNPYKDFETLKKGWIKANKKLGTDGVDLICLGGKPSEEKHGERTLFVLEKKTPEEVRAFMEKSLLVVQISKQDNAPLAVLEAHLAGKKVVASLDGGIPELLDETELCWLHEPQNATDLADKLVAAINSEKDERIAVHASFESVVDTYLGHSLQMVND